MKLVKSWDEYVAYLMNVCTCTHCK